MTKKEREKIRLKFDLYQRLLNTSPVEWSGHDSTLLHILATDDDVIMMLEKSHRFRANHFKYGSGCSMNGCGCRSFRSENDSLVRCKCSHLTHDHYIKKENANSAKRTTKKAPAQH